MSWHWPLFDEIRKNFSEDGSFGAIRKHDIHTGVDLYCHSYTPVLAVEDGEIVGIEDFTGQCSVPPSPWWHDTKALLVEGKSGVVVYGEIEPYARKTNQIRRGVVLGAVLQVLKEDKGKPMSMLHLELYKKGTRNTVWWYHGESQPENLLDPTLFLMDANNINF